MVNAQKIRYSDQEIEEFVQERKVLPDQMIGIVDRLDQIKRREN